MKSACKNDGKLRMAIEYIMQPARYLIQDAKIYEQILKIVNRMNWAGTEQLLPKVRGAVEGAIVTSQ